MTTPPPSPVSDAPSWACPRCAAAWPHEGWRERFTPFGAAERVIGCPACLYRDFTLPEVRANTIAAYGLEAGKLAGMTLAAFRPLTAKERLAQDAAEKVAARWREGVSRSLWLWSELVEPPELRDFGKAGRCAVSGCGTGKTHLAVALAKQALELGRTVKIAAEIDLFSEIRASYGDNAERSERQIISDLTQPWLLVWDDVGTQDVKALGWYQSIIGGVIDTRYKADRPIILTTNLTPDAFAERIGARAMSRLEDMAVGVHLDGPDRRRMK